MLDADEDVPRGRHEDAGCRRGRHEDVPLLAAVALLSAMQGSAHADSPPRTRPDATEPTTTVHQSVAAFEEAVYSGCGLPSLKSVTLLLDAVLLEAPAGIDGQTRLVGTMRILARALRQVYLLRGGEEGCVGGPALLCSSNWRLFLLASVLLASKFAEDEYADTWNPGLIQSSAAHASSPAHTHSHVELVELHKIAALGLPVGVHMPSCGQIASAEIALLRLLEWHAGFNGGELSRQRMHLARLAEQARPTLCSFLVHSSTAPPQAAHTHALSAPAVCRWWARRRCSLRPTAHFCNRDTRAKSFCPRGGSTQSMRRSSGCRSRTRYHRCIRCNRSSVCRRCRWPWCSGCSCSRSACTNRRHSG